MFVSADRSLFFPFCHSLLPGKRARRMECCDSFYKHVGMYAYRPEVLREITALPQGKLERQNLWNNCVGLRTVIRLR